MKLFLPIISLVVVLSFAVDPSGRINHNPQQVYDLANGVLSTDFHTELGHIDIPEGKQVNAWWITGEMASQHGYLNGLYFDLKNVSEVGDTQTDPTRVRGLIGQVMTVGPGSVRGIHAHAIGAPGSTGMINAINAQVSAADTTTRASALQISNTGSDVADGILYGGSQPLRYGINMAEFGTYDQATIYLPVGESGAIKWTNGTKLYVEPNGALIVKFSNGVTRTLAAP